MINENTSVPALINRDNHHSRKIIVIGAGFGGLAAAIRLQAAGYVVTLVEARERPGGRAYQLQEAGYTFDMGPTLITAPHLLEDLWHAAGRELSSDLKLIPLSPFYRINFQDGRYFDYWGTTEQDEVEIAKFEVRDVAGYHRFLKDTRWIYERAFLDLATRPFTSLKSFISVIPELMYVGAQRNVYSFVSRYFHNPYVRMVFSFHPLFIGGNPFRASAIYSIVPYLERAGGVHYTMGGIYTLVQAMEKLYRSSGGEVMYGRPVIQLRVRNQRVTGVCLEDGTALDADVVVANSDIATTYLKLLPQEYQSTALISHMKRYHYSMSCYLFYLGLNRHYEQLRHHTIIMPNRYRHLIEHIFDGYGLPNDLALYLHTPSRTDPSMAPSGGESMYILVPVPNLDHGINWHEEAPAFRERVLNFLEQYGGLDGLSQSIVSEHTFSPVDFATTLRSHAGAAFSIEPTLFQSAYFRPHNRSPYVQGLYFVGAGTHPGAGIPGVLLTASITSRMVIDDLVSKHVYI